MTERLQRILTSVLGRRDNQKNQIFERNSIDVRKYNHEWEKYQKGFGQNRLQCKRSIQIHSVERYSKPIEQKILSDKKPSRNPLHVKTKSNLPRSGYNTMTKKGFCHASADNQTRTNETVCSRYLLSLSILKLERLSCSKMTQ